MSHNYLSKTRLYNYERKYESYDKRSEFQKDYQSIIYSSAFRRLQDKTQVFPLDQSDYVRTRLTHSLEVAAVAKAIVQAACRYMNSKDSISEDEKLFVQHEADLSEIVQCAALLHDIGNPPFGHFGETIIGNWFSQHLDDIKDSQFLTPQMCSDLTKFEGNAQALRIIARLQNIDKACASDFTCAVLNSIIKYPIPSNYEHRNSDIVYHHKFGYFLAEEDKMQSIVNQTGYDRTRYVLTYILEAADDIAYRIADTDDAFKKGLVTPHDFYQSLENFSKLHNTDGKYSHLDTCLSEFEDIFDNKTNTISRASLSEWFTGVQSKLIAAATFSFTNNFNDIVNGTYPYDLFRNSYSESLVKFFKQIAIDYIFDSPELVKLEIAANEILEFLLSKFCHAITDYDPFEMIPSKNALHQKLCLLISDNYKNECKNEFKWLESQPFDDDLKKGYQLYFKLLLVTDYISGMTDSYAKRLYQELNGTNL